MVMSFTIRETFPFVMSMSEERLFTFGTNKMFYMPMFTKSCYNPFLDRAPTCATNRYSHLIVTSQTIQFVRIIRGESGSATNFSRISIKLHAAGGTIEVIRVIDFPAEF